MRTDQEAGSNQFGIVRITRCYPPLMSLGLENYRAQRIRGFGDLAPSHLIFTIF